jgi:cobalt-precorrin-5B (C1)-methyltransferase
MRSGYATSACAAAAAAAGIRVLQLGHRLDQIDIDLPSAKGVVFNLARCEIDSEGVCCGIIKDAGDDPDVTNGIEIQAYVRAVSKAGITLNGGKGVGTVTLPGLPLAVGEAAINPGPRKLITRVIQQELSNYQEEMNRGYEITIQVPDGESIAEQTMNPKLGIVGGISILGTDGLVRPYSVPAFRTSLYYELRVAFENGYRVIGLATGKRSSAYLQDVLHDTEGLGVLDVGDELGYPIEQAVKMGFEKIIVGGMIGKLSKLAQGRFQTHVNEGEVDFDFLAQVAAGQNASTWLCDRIRSARTAHQVQTWLTGEGITIEAELARRAAEQVFNHVKKQVSVGVIIFSLNGDLLGEANIEAAHGE